MALSVIQTNNRARNKTLRHVASGVRLNSAGDDASAYAISERMRVQLRSLDQDEQNVKNGRDLLAVADGGIQNIISQLRTMKELALNAANDHNTDADRATLQKEFEARREGIDEIAAETNYNGKLLLDGNYGRKKVESAVSIEPSGAAATITGVGTASALATYTISSDGVYQLDASCQFCKIEVNAANVEIRGSGSQNTNIYIECQKADTNLWLDSMNVYLNRQDTKFRDMGADISFLRFGSSTSNTLHLKNSNTIESHTSRGYPAGVPRTEKALVHIGGGLSIYGNGTLTMDLKSRTGGEFGAFIGTDAGEVSSANLVIHGGTLLACSHRGAAIGSGNGGSMGDITIDGGTITAYTTVSAPIGSGAFGSVGNITIRGGMVTAEASQQGNAGIGGGSNSTVGDIKLEGGKIHASTMNFNTASDAPVIGAGTLLAPGEKRH